MDKLAVFVRQMHLKMAMIATTPENALQAVQEVISAGIPVIWNFTPAKIPDYEGVIVQNTPSSFDIDNDYQIILTRL